ncbi:duf862 domain containing protein [Grosmannia clavigera kw1407]|uniref:Duf862 domain containing protein n=1 Tax=Grosmannia clavigera (strain kw1407 / UAMH 11150) TaxID=655863 RepID=F0XUZ1_GROCL|nr:duf862 domain containing protein [Grosmannia clavigera kw1407]EFW98463.1 duf862 domain containing protein [Grosmannia clavigera kw1407]
MAPKVHKKSNRARHRSTLSLQKTEVIINVYDLLAPGRLSSFLWFVGTSLLHSGVVVNGREYAYGGHDRHGVTGVYWTKPRSEPPGGTFRCEILHGFTLATPDEIEAIIRTTSAEFLGPSYNLLTRNCNHFTAYLCRKLTGRPGPPWLNRAASIGVALPCVVPREWIEPPEYDTADGELLLSDDEDDIHDERTGILRVSSPQVHLIRADSNEGTSASDRLQQNWDDEDERRSTGSGEMGKGKGRAGPMRDCEGRALPPSERLRA